jgi:hypothetical protein
MKFLDKSKELFKKGLIVIYDFFPKTLTFWSVLFYFFFFYFIVYVIFSTYIYVNGLEYEIDCEHNDKCLKIKKKGDENKEDKINKGETNKINDDTYINPNRLYL